MKGSREFKGKIPEVLDKNYYQSLNGLRAISILIVIASHASHEGSISIFKAIPGNFGVSIFFVLSGFLITTLLLKEKYKSGNISIKSFYLRRALRILPAAYLFVVVLIILNYKCALKIEWLSIISSFGFFRNLIPSNSWNQYNSHLWTLSVEEQFYVFFPFVLALNSRIYFILVTGLCILSPFTLYGDAHHIFPFNNQIVHLIGTSLKMQTGILVGSLCSLLMFKFPKWSNKFRINGSTTCLLLVFACILQIKELSIIPDSCLLISDSFIALVLVRCVSLKSCWFTNLLNSKVMNQIGVLSYSLYIWQEIFLYKTPTTGRYIFFQNPLLNIVSIIIVAMISYYFLEKPILNLKVRLTSNSLSPTLSLQ